MRTRPSGPIKPEGKLRADRPLVAAALLGGPVVLATALRAYGIGAKCVWVDEANSVLIADRPLGEIVERLGLDSSPPLYYFLLHYWIELFGASPAAVRSFSALFGVILVAAVFEIGRRTFSTRAGAIAALLLAVAPVQVLYSQEARMYTLLPLLAAGALHFTDHYARLGGRANAAGAVLLTAAALYTHNYAFFLAPAQLVIALGTASARRRLRGWTAIAGAVLVLYLPWLPIFLEQLASEGHYAWLEGYWNRLGALGMLRETARSFAFGSGGFAALAGGKAGGFVLIAILSFGLVLFAPWGDPSGGPGSSRVWHLAAFLLAPLASALIVSAALTPCYVPGRCDQIVYPAFVLLVALGISAVGPALARFAILGVLCASAGSTLAEHYRVDAKAGDRAYALAVLRAASPGEVVICTSLTRASLEYYARLEGKRLQLLSYPRDTEQHLGNQDNRALIEDEARLAEEADLVIEEARQRTESRGTFFVLAATVRVNRPLRTRLEELLREKKLEMVEQLGEFKQALVRDPVLVLRLRFTDG